VAVLLFALAGLFGKWISLSPLMIVLGRTAFAAVTLALLLIKTPSQLTPRIRHNIGVIALSGLLLAFHWVTFFRAIQISNVAIGLVTFSSFPVFVTCMEPVLFREKLRLADLFSAAIVVAGLVCIVPHFDLSNHVTLGAIWGTASGLSFAVLTLLNRSLVAQSRPLIVALGQDAVAACAMAILLPFYAQPISLHDLALLIVLGVVCTAIAHCLFIASLQHMRAQLVSIVGALEALYGTILAMIFLHERPSVRTILGGALILAAVVMGTFLHRWREPDV